MNLTIWESLLVGLVSGFSEILPISARAHRAFADICFGIRLDGHLFSLLSHLAVLSVVAFSLRFEISRLRRAAGMMRGRSRRRHQQPDYASASTVRHLRSAMAVTAVVRLVTGRLFQNSGSLLLLAVAMLVGGALLYLPERMPGGNKDGRNMAKLDSLLMGACAGFGAVPGLSTLGTAIAAGELRAVDRSYALRFALLLMIPALGVDCVMDVLMIIGSGALPGLMGMLTALPVPQ